MKHKQLTAIEQNHLKKVRKKLRGYERVRLRSGFVASRAEIEDAIVIKRGLEQFKQGKYKGNWQ